MKAKSLAEVLAIGMEKAVEVGDCLEWQGSFSNGGTQPSVKFRLPGKTYSDNLSVPRLLWEQKRGPIPEGMQVYRKCCNNACVCISHLAMGTRQDMMTARRKAGKTKLSPATVIAITLSARRREATVNSPERAALVRQMLASGKNHTEVAEATGVSITMVHDIGRGRRWRDLGSPWAGLGAR